MKTQLSVLLMTCLLTFGCQAQPDEIKSIKTVITQFAKAGDQNKPSEVSTYLDPNYRIIMNQLFGSSETSIVDRELYLNKIESKEWGGDTRKLTFLSVDVNGNNASVKVEMKGEKVTMTSYMILVKNKDGKWKIVSDNPYIG
ncbi:MAG: nuclear transport factor 2 family protein [Cyclobacteriaceae bacterium]